MNFTFGIITDGKNTDLLNNTIESIHSQKIINYEIIVVGNIKNINTLKNQVINLDFDESIKSGWITKKKNLITQNSNFSNIVFMHDYIKLDKNWYSGFKKFGSDFKVATNKILNLNNTRYRDWCLWPHNNHEIDKIVEGGYCLLPYRINNLSKFMYISGAYWVAKKYVMEEFPLNENLIWGEAEDVEWSKRVREKYEFKFNKFSTVNLQKQKNPIFYKTNYSKLRMINRLI